MNFCCWVRARRVSFRKKQITGMLQRLRLDVSISEFPFQEILKVRRTYINTFYRFRTNSASDSNSQWISKTFSRMSVDSVSTKRFWWQSSSYQPSSSFLGSR
ncbi:hypothetical protein NPIL_422721 [Nephila pilipes]|uniref:Uncharacterized protein n=1 Tax=Nephila pilipes TaxID=299642 RepID=A0A8X6NHX5_NEPPI|nr:hypothetical protein NPIL_422721 [Nephila pilipes]